MAKELKKLAEEELDEEVRRDYTEWYKAWLDKILEPASLYEKANGRKEVWIADNRYFVREVTNDSSQGF